MKKLKLIFFFVIIGYCFTVDTDNCTIRYETALRDKCINIDTSCSFKRSNYSKLCISMNDCSKGYKDNSICSNIFDKNNFPLTKCDYVGENCNAISTTCNDYNNGINTVNFYKDRDLCGKFKTSDNDNKKCLLDNGFQCGEYYKSCTNLERDACINNNLLPSYKAKCKWVSTGTPHCEEEPITCDYSLYNVNENECDELKTSDINRSKCVYFDKKCLSKPLCEQKQPTTEYERECTEILPLKGKGNGGYEFDYKYKCTYVLINSQPSCKKVDRNCEYNDDFKLNNFVPSPSICSQLKTTNENKRCVYDSNEKSCKEEYKTCELYSEKEINKDRGPCEALIMVEENTKCVYDIEEDKCVTEKTYASCDEYEGISKKICESIKPSSHSRCVLDKDSKCKERAFLCSEVFDEVNCLYYAKASTSNKRCAYEYSSPHIGKCYEEYLRCEDFIETDSNSNTNAIDCSRIRLYDGKKCEWDYSLKRCISKNKTCSEVYTKEDCNLIAESGVSNPDKLVCRWLDYDNYGNRQLDYGLLDDDGNPTPIYACRETYKYCSDYRGTNDNFCKNNIKPYNELEDKIDITSKCEYESNIGCEKIPKECSDANKNPVLCALISPKIKDNEIKYCAYIGEQCETYFKKCEYWRETDNTDACTNNIPENYLDNPCETKDIDGKTTCVNKKICNIFPSMFPSTTDNSNLCHSINHDCELTSEGCVTKEILGCKDIEFYKYSDENEEICKNKEASVPYKICTLKEDKSGCEEIINVSYLSPSNPPPEDSAGFITKGIPLILIILYLLI